MACVFGRELIGTSSSSDSKKLDRFLNRVSNHHYEVRVWVRGSGCAFFSFAFLSVLFVDPLSGESTMTFFCDYN